LNRFYDPESQGKFPGQQMEIPLKPHQIFPHALFYSSLLGVTLATEAGRHYYLKAWQFGFVTWLCTPILYKLSSFFD